MRKIVNKTKASNKRFEALFKGIPIPTYIWQKIDDDLILINYNTAADILTKGMIENYISIKASELYKNQPEIFEELFRCANEHINIFREMEYNFISTGERKFLSVKYGFVPPDLVIVHTEDITVKKNVMERLKESEKELKELNLKLEQIIGLSEEKYKTIFENTGTATVVIEEDTTISLANEQFEELSGYSREEIEWKKNWTEFVIEEDMERMKELHYSRREDPESTQKKYEFRFVNKEGTIRDILIVIDIIPGAKKSIASLLDISERKKTEEKLKDSEEKYRYLFDNAQVGLYWSGISDGKILECNETFAKLFGYDVREECLAYYNVFEHYIDPNERSEILEEIRDKKEVKNYEIHVTKRDGTPIWLSISSRMSEKENRIEGAAIDITERKKAEEIIKKEVEKLKNYLNIAGVLIVALDIEGNITLLNKKGHEILQYNEGELIGKNWFKICLSEEYSLSTYKTFEKLIQGRLENVEFFENPILTKNGDEKIIAWHNSLLFDSNGNIIGTLSSGEDITERKQAERELQFERDNLLNILNSMEDGVYIVDSNYNIEYVNPILIKEFGPFEGIKCFEYFHDRNEFCPRCKNKVIAQGKSARWEWYSFKNQKTYDLVDTPLKNPDGSISKLEIFRDISDIKKAEQELKESEENYREAYNRAEFYKDIFAHDINNILQSILSGIQISQIILEDPEKLDTLKVNAQIIKEQVIRGAKLVSNVRKLSQLEYPERNLEKIEILNVLNKIISIVKKSYEDKNLSIRIDSVAEEFFTKTNNYLEDVFENLLINAIKHNQNLTIKIIVKILKEQQNDINYVKMEFQDNGIGVADSMKQRIFKRGYNKEEIYLGMGLGLSLVRGIIESYNGKIWVEDRVRGDRSKGSNFVILIPEVD